MNVQLLLTDRKMIVSDDVALLCDDKKTGYVDFLFRAVFVCLYG